MWNWIYPQVCVLCGRAAVGAGEYLCGACPTDRLTPAPASEALLPEGLEAAQAAWAYDKRGDIQALLHALKYGGLRRLGVELGRLAAASFDPTPYHALLPVPLHPRRLRQRGYNQAEAIAEGVAEATGLPLVPAPAVVRVRATRTQTGFNLFQRGENMREAFRVAEPAAVAGKRLLLVDDVMTTGATLFELHRMLHAAGAGPNGAFTLAQA